MADSLFDLSEKIALVSGASRGIGEAIARTLAEHNAHVIVSSRKREDCEAVASAIRGSGGSAEAFPCHVGRMEDIAAMFDPSEENPAELRAYSRRPRASRYLCQQCCGESLLRPHPRYGSRCLHKDRRGEHPRLFLHVRGGRQAHARQRRRGNREHGVDQRDTARATAGHLLDHQGRYREHDEGLRQGVCAAGYPLQCAPARSDAHEVRRRALRA